LSHTNYITNLDKDELTQGLSMKVPTIDKRIKHASTTKCVRATGALMIIQFQLD